VKKRFAATVSVIIALVALCAFVGQFGVVGAQSSTLLNEGFEAGGKTAYAAANITLGSGSWYLDEALTGSTTSDRKTGSWSARVRDLGKVRMNFNVASAGTVTVQHAKYGADASSAWELWQSTDSGSTWTKVGATVTTGSTTLSTASFTVNNAGAIRFEIRKTSGGANRINLDNIAVTSYGIATPTPTPPVSTGVHLTMGNPSGALADANFPTNYLMEKPQYAMSYHRDDGRPNWVAWHLDATWLGSTARQDDFRADTTLPSGWYRVTATDYSGSGYDRGHMCPSADRTKTVADNSSTFLMTNMIPQAPDNNQQTWANLETYGRTLANGGNELYIISGGQGATGFIANGHVAVPAYTWKVIMVLPGGINDVERVTGSTRLIAVWMPNQNGISTDWRSFRVSVDYVESMTGYDFFANVPDVIESQIESAIDNQLIEDWEMTPDKAAIEEALAESSDVKPEMDRK
jgi:endonuclease G